MNGGLGLEEVGAGAERTGLLKYEETKVENQSYGSRNSIVKRFYCKCRMRQG